MQHGKRGRGGRKGLLPALVALGGSCGLLAGPAAALELGELHLRSSLGQPLRASVAYALQPNEQIHNYCIYVNPGSSPGGLPSVGKTAIIVSGGTIRISGREALKEPLLSLQLTVDCPHAAHIRRDYSVFLAPRRDSQQQAVEPAAAAIQPVARARTATSQRTTVTVRPVVHTPIEASGSYRVQPGDSLSGIAARISGRRVAIWPAVEALFAANPDAFIDNDRNLLRAGSVLLIPDAIVAPQAAASVKSVAVPSAARPVTAAQEQPPAATLADTGSDSVSGTVESSISAPVTDAVVTPRGTTDGESAPAQQAATPRPGDVLVSDGPFKTPVDADAAVRDVGTVTPSRVIPSTATEDVAGSATAVQSQAATSDSWSWLIWLAGSGVALILGLLLFGRQLKAKLAPGSAPMFARHRTDSGNLDDTDIAPVSGLPSQGTAQVARMVSLDADLEDGSGFQSGGDMNIAQTFGFSEDSGEFRNRLDMNLANVDDSTDVIAPRRAPEASILVSETPPQYEDSGEYDVSMMVDATKQILEDPDETARDLGAIEVDAEDGSVSEEYTLSKDVDYQVLEQDYEDELTATQALNAEIARAARALSKQFGKDEMGDTMNEDVDETGSASFSEAFNEAFDDKTSQLPLKDKVALDDETTALPAADTHYLDAHDTKHLSVSSTMTLDDTANEEIALEVPPAENDSGVEVEIESASVDTRKMRAS